MYKVILAGIVATGIFVVPAAATEKPTSTKHTIVVKKVVKKPVKRKKYAQAVKVAPEHNPFLKNDSIFNSSTIDQSSSEYWAEEKRRKDTIEKGEQNLFAGREEKPTKVVSNSREVLRKKIVTECGWFSCTNVVVAEAKKWEGKNAKKDNRELKDLFAKTGQGPVDPVHTPWCAAFANAILRRLEVEGTDSLMARSFLHWGVNTKNPKEGDIVVLARGKDGWSGHVGFFMGYEVFDGVKYVKVLGGNTDKNVQVGYFPASKVVGYRTYA